MLITNMMRAMIFERTTPVTEKNVLARLALEEEQYLAQPLRAFTLATTISIRTPLASFTTRFRGVHVRVLPEMPDEFVRARAKAHRAIPREDVSPAGYSTLLASVHAHTPEAAAELTLDAVTCLRGMWNFAHRGLGVSLSYSSDEPDSINWIRLGRVHTMHHDDGTRASEGYFYDPGAVGQTLFNRADLLPEVRAFVTRVRKKLRRFEPQYRRDLERAFSRYARALDTRDFESALLKLWGVLELITHVRRKNFGDIARRAAFVWPERTWARAVLEHLRDRRNAFVHEQESNDAPDRLVWQLKRYVDRLLLFHLRAGTDFGSLEAAARFLDLPSEQEELRAEMRRVRRALRFLYPQRRDG